MGEGAMAIGKRKIAQSGIPLLVFAATFLVPGQDPCICTGKKKGGGARSGPLCLVIWGEVGLVAEIKIQTQWNFCKIQIRFLALLAASTLLRYAFFF